jgi:Bax inhibitor 1
LSRPFSSRETQAHLSQVYAALIAGVAFSAVGVYIQFTMYLAGTLTYIATFGLLAWILFDSDKQTTPKVLDCLLSTATRSCDVSLAVCPQRLALFAGFCVFEGISIGDLVRVAMLMDKAIVMTALLGTTTVFACFSIASLLCTSCLSR